MTECGTKTILCASLFPPERYTFKKPEVHGYPASDSSEAGLFCGEEAGRVCEVVRWKVLINSCL